MEEEPPHNRFFGGWNIRWFPEAEADVWEINVDTLEDLALGADVVLLGRWFKEPMLGEGSFLCWDCWRFKSCNFKNVQIVQDMRYTRVN